VFLPWLASDHDPPTYTCHVAGIAGVSLHAQHSFWIFVYFQDTLLGVAGKTKTSIGPIPQNMMLTVTPYATNLLHYVLSLLQYLLEEVLGSFLLKATLGT
jgi:hypothetical protein